MRRRVIDKGCGSFGSDGVTKLHDVLLLNLAIYDKKWKRIHM